MCHLLRELALDVGAGAVIAGEAAVVGAGAVKLLAFAHIETLAQHAQHQRPPSDAAVKLLQHVPCEDDVCASCRALLREP